MLAATATAGMIAAPLAGAEAEPVAVETTTLGSQGKLVDGTVIQGWTVTDLKQSSDTIPHPVAGTLWEVTATDQAIQGSVTPIVSNFNVRASDGTTYRALWGAATPQGVNPATIAQGQETSGKIYFDVTGPAPDTVVYNAGGQDLLVWTEPPASSSTGSSPSTYRSYPAQSPASAAPAEAATETPEGTATPAATETLPEGSQGTPLPEGSQGTPLPEGSQGTPIVEGAPAPAASGAPVPAAAGTPVPPAQGTPVPPAQGAPVPPAQGAPAPAAGTEGAPLPAGSQGTPVPAGDEVPTPVIYAPAP
ncbi:MPT63 family protein [Mycolicibacterium flavescens]|uniref:Phosphopeptide-binding protein n=2 Tax=Mycolicibacterium flavescens TaxID=1776 RepID=A0A1E3RK66_MYCFV|nr:MPT63 family protein [Mycolicibacterium flavescens]ODQ90248.1 phosphopeptide-binding protein [Mycolicibacterium flavescens]